MVLTERAVRSAKHLLERAQISKSDVYLDLLNLRNVARDGTLGSPAQRLMSRLTRPPVPIAQQQLVPQVLKLKPATIQKRLQEKHDIQKRSYDSSSRPLRPFLPGQVVRLRTSTGHSHSRLQALRLIFQVRGGFSPHALGPC